MTIIYLIAEPDFHFPEDWSATALTEDGRQLATYVYLEEEKARTRLERAHGLYSRACPEGFTLVWMEQDPEGCAEARRRYQEAWDAARPAREAEQKQRMEALREQRRIPAPEVPMNVESELEALKRATETAWRADEEDEED